MCVKHDDYTPKIELMSTSAILELPHVITHVKTYVIT